MSQVSQEFYCGNYSAVLKFLGTAPLFKTKNEALWPYQIGSLVFSGELLEAQTLFLLALKKNHTKHEALSEARFFLGIGFVRKSKYEEATRHFAENLNDYRLQRRKKSATWKEAFFAYQGAAFFNFFNGRYKKSLRLAEKAYQSAFEGAFQFGLAFASELMGHCNCQLGEVYKGIKDFDKAIQHAAKMGNGGLENAFKIAKEKFKAQYGTDVKHTEKNLYASLRTLKSEDTYSKAELYLELSRQLTLRGKCNEAKDLLDKNAESIYKHQNRRQSATFSLRYSHILHLQGESQAALTLLRSSKGNLVPKIDKVYLKQLQGLEEKILSDLNPSIEASKYQTHSLTFIDERIEQRKRALIENSNSKQDVIGDILDRAMKQSLDFAELEKNKLFGLVPLILKQKESATFAFLGPKRGQLILYSKGNTHWVSKGTTQPMIKILSLLGDGATHSKEEIIQSIWGYVYRPDRHDNLLHATIGKLRKHMGIFNDWIQWDSGGYKLKNQVAIIKPQSTPAFRRPINYPNLSIKLPAPIEPSLETEQLNHRQVKLIRELKAGSFIGVTEYSKKFRICKMTACRDLSALSKAKILKKLGRARATQYCIRGSKNETI